MVIDGQSIIDRHLVTIPEGPGIDTEKQIQPNGIDLRVESISVVQGVTDVPRDDHVGYQEISYDQLPVYKHRIYLEGGKSYVVNFRETISVQDGFCAIIVPRSSLLRTGTLITSALWDTGFNGKLGGVIRPLNDLKIEPGARLAQVLFLQAEFNGKRYEGRYQGHTSQTALMTNG